MRGTIGLLLLLLLCQTAWSYMVAKCPTGWLPREGNDECYLIHSYGHDRTWSDARTYCKGRGGDLVHIQSEAVKEFLSQKIAATGEVGENGYFWTSAKKTDGEWKWQDTGKNIDLTIIQWEEDTGEGSCAVLTGNSKLYRLGCGQKTKFLCVRPITKPPACDYDAGWEQQNNKCYKASDEQDSWHDAAVLCNVDGGSVASVTSEKENQLIHDYALEHHDNMWIGYTDEGHPGTYKWMDGSTSNYTKWQDGQPDASVKGMGAAVVSKDDVNGTWVAEKTTDEFHYACKKNKGACFNGWETFQKSCYYFNTENQDSVVWEDAKSTCEQVGAYLVVLDTPAEDTWFRNHIPGNDEIWVGLYSKPGDNLYWVDGARLEQKNVTQMSQEDMDNAIDKPDQQCVYSHVVDSKSSWVPTDCATPRHYACEVAQGDSIHLIPPSNKRYCPEGWSKNLDYCYLFVTEEKSWTAAHNYCNNRQSDLVSIVTWSEQDYVKNNQVGGAWMGLNDRATDNKWVWSDGAAVTITNWNDYEPSGGVENCAEMVVDIGKWNDLPCDEQRAFTCKMEASKTPLGIFTTSSTSTPDYSICGHGWTENTLTGECYRLVLEELSFADARLHCREYGHADGQTEPDLLSVYSAQEQTFVYSLLAAQHLSQTEVWIGLKNDANEGAYWSDGTPVAYLNWENGEPNGYGYEPCVEMYTGSGTWNDGYCDIRHAFICEKKGSNYIGPQPPPPPSAQCSEGWSYFDNHCYRLSDDTATWDAANSSCGDFPGSFLTSVASSDENEFLVHLMGNEYSIWLGLHDDNAGANWHWIDGSPYIWDQTYTNWGEGEPNNIGGEHCGEMRIDYYMYEVGQWNDMPCDSLNRYVCKQSVKTCPHSWQYQNGKCYYASDYSATWHEAEGKCKLVNSGAELVSLHSDEENELFRGLLTHTGPATWIGLNYLTNTSTWVWTDGQDTDYLHWNSGEPNNLDGLEYCSEMIDSNGGYDDGTWNNLACTESRNFGCEYLPTHRLGCDDGWQTFGDYCYWFSSIDDTTDTFANALALCQNIGGDLASVHSAEEYDFLYSMLDEYPYTDTWLGMTDDGHTGSLVWTDGTEITYTKLGTLTSYDLAYSPICGVVGYDYFVTYSTQWLLEDCDYLYYFICKTPQHTIEINPPNSGCQGSDLPYKTSCYSVVDASQSWSAAESDCQARNNSHLVVINDRYESAYISAIIGEVGDRTWLGMSGTIEGDGSVTFTWVNGDDVDFTYWDEYEPAPDHGTCVSASGDETNPGLWAIANCEDNFKYICEYGRVGYTTPAPPTTKPPGYYCLADWTHEAGRCYKMVKQASSWGEGEQYCRSFGGNLVSIESEAEENVIKVFSSDSATSKVWVGLSMSEDQGYAWSDGAAFDYVNWDNGQPDTNNQREMCVGADKNSLKLKNFHCDAHLNFICEAREGTMVTTAAPPTKPPSQKCSDDDSWFLYEGYCYKFISEVDQTPHSWWESHHLCREEGGELASIHTIEENYWIESMIYQFSDTWLWLGASASIDSGFEWLDTTPFDFEDWNDGEPNNMHDQEDCVSLYTHTQGYWNDMNCGDPMGRICKRQHGYTHPPSKTTTPPPGHCPDGWTHTGTKCVLFVEDWVTFDTARADCQARGSGVDLASIHSAAEEAYLVSALGVLKVDFWLGMKYGSGFHWVDQTQVHYTNWGPGEPSRHNDVGQAEDCVHAYSGSGKWNDIDCYATFNYICMMNQDPSLDNHNPPTFCLPPYDNYVLYNGACYLAVNTPSSWQDAEATCQQDGAHLTSILSYAEDSFVWVVAQETDLPETWTGLNDLQDHEMFQWVDGWPTVYTNWGLDQPTTNTTNSRCVKVDTNDGLWSTQPCDSLKTFICKYTNQSAVTPDPPSTGRCPDSRWMDLGGAYCYLVSEEKKNWNDANMNCLQESSNLASIHSSEENQLITMATSSVSSPLWIGLVQKSNGYGWSDGTGFNFINWEDNEPNMEEEQCVEMNDKGKWNDALCGNENLFLCKVKKEQEVTNPTFPPTHGPGGGGGGDGSNPLSGGAIAGIVIAVLVVVAAVGFVGYSYTQKPKQTTAGDAGSTSFANIFSKGDDSTKKPKNSDTFTMDAGQGGSEA